MLAAIQPEMMFKIGHFALQISLHTLPLLGQAREPGSISEHGLSRSLREGFGLAAVALALVDVVWIVVDGGQSDAGVGQVVRGIIARDDAGHGSVVDAGDEVADVLVAGEWRRGLEIGLFAGLFTFEFS